MALIPQYVSKETPTTSPGADFASAKSTGGPVETSFITNKVGEQAGDQLMDLGKSMRRIEIYNAESKADIATMNGMLAIEQKVKASNDPKAADDIDQELYKMGEAVAKDFPDQVSAQMWKNKWGETALKFKTSMQGEVAKKQVDIARTNTLTQMDMAMSDYINAPDETARAEARKNVEAKMSVAQQAQLFGSEEGYKVTEGMFKDADATIKDNEKLKARKEKELARAQELAVKQIEKDYVSMKRTGKDKLGMPVSSSDLLKMINSDKQTSPEFKEAYKRAITSAKAVTDKKHNKAFGELILDISKGTKSSSDVLISIMEKEAKGELNPEEIEAAETFLSMVGENDPQDLVATEVRKTWFGFGTEKDVPIKRTEEEQIKADESDARMALNYIKKLQQNKSPGDAFVETMREENLNLFSQARSAPDGIKLMDSLGRVRILLPNGDLKPAETKK